MIKTKKMNKLLTVIMVGMLSGCASVNYGPLTVRSLGTDIAVENAQWIKTVQPDGTTTEALTVQGGQRNSTGSFHTGANLSMSVLGALIGSAAGVPGAAAGAAAGASTAELYQMLRDWLNKPNTNTAVVVPTPLPTPTPVDATEQSMGLDMATVIRHDSANPAAAKITDRISNLGLTPGSPRLSIDRSLHAWPSHDGNTDGWILVFWRPDGVWHVGIIECAAVGSYVYSDTLQGMYNNTVFAPKPAEGDDCGFCAISEDGSQRSNVIFGKWPLPNTTKPSETSASKRGN